MCEVVLGLNLFTRFYLLDSLQNGTGPSDHYIKIFVSLTQLLQVPSIQTLFFF